MQIRGGKKNTEPTDQDADPQHCFSYIKINNFLTIFKINFNAYSLLATSVVLRTIVPPRMVRGAELGAGHTVGQLPAHSTQRISRDTDPYHYQCWGSVTFWWIQRSVPLTNRSGSDSFLQ
jgi:hypothetical protein